jgi:hypothetical protein
VPRHEARDRAGKITLRTAHELGAALAGPGKAGEADPVVVRTDGPHRSIDGLAALIDAALEDDRAEGERRSAAEEGDADEDGTTEAPPPTSP